MYRIAIVLSTLIMTHSSLAASACRDELQIGKRPNRKLAGAGTILVLKEKLVQIAFKDGGQLGTEPAVSVKAYIPELPLFAKQVVHLQPGDEVEMMDRVKKIANAQSVRIRILESGEEAAVYWVDLYNNTVVQKVGSAPPPMKKKVEAKFPVAMDTTTSRDELWRTQRTQWGRPFAKIGDIVWMGNHGRIMSRGSVGELIGIEENGLVVVKNLRGTIVRNRSSQVECPALTEGELAWLKD